MKKLIFRNFLKDIGLFFIFSSFALALIVWVVQSVNFLDLVSEDGHSLKVYFLYSMFSFPKIISKILMFSFFISVFYVILKYEENNEILIYWTHGIKKIDFINNLLKFSFIVLVIQLLLSIFVVPKTLDQARAYLRDSNIDYFPSLIKSKQFIDAISDLTIFIEKKNANGEFENIFLKDKYTNDSSQIISAKKGRIVTENQNHYLVLDEGKILNIDKKNITTIKFNKTKFDLSKHSTKTIVWPKLQEIKTLNLLKCIYSFENKNYVYSQKRFLCNQKQFNNIVSEVAKRIIKPIYILIITLISSFLILKHKNEKNIIIYKFILFFLGIVFLTTSEVTTISIDYYSYNKILFIILPFILTIFIYLGLLIKLNSKSTKKL